jgi:large subunit ribosomal protein L23
MALFGLKKEKKTTKAVAKKVVKIDAVNVSANIDHSGIIIRPRITEKSGVLSAKRVYTFEISANANKNAVSSAIQSLYKVIPTKISIINLPRKSVFVRGKSGFKSAVRKALVTLKEGDKIDFI